MKRKLFAIAAVIVAMFTSASCTKENTNQSDDARVWFIMHLDDSSGITMSKATNSEVYALFYEKLLDGSLAALTYNLKLTEQTTGLEYTFTGKWGDQFISTIKSGKYKLVGDAIAEGNYIQEKCSFSFSQDVDIVAGDNEVSLTANYESFLLIFTSQKIESLQNNSGTVCEDFYSLGDYKYAFVNYLLYDVNYVDDACIQGKVDGKDFKTPTGKLAFEIGKYYIYNEVGSLVNIPNMNEGSVEVITPNESEVDPDITTINLPPSNEIWYTSIDGEVVDFNISKVSVVSNTYENGMGKCVFSANISSFNTESALSENGRDNIKSLILPSSITYLGWGTLSGLKYADTLILPKNLSSIGTDFLCALGEEVDVDRHIYFLSDTAPSTSWRAIWNVKGNFIIHYPSGAEYSSINSCLSSWAYYQKNLTWTMVETKYNLVEK